MMDICEAFRRQASKTWGFLEQSRGLPTFHPKEEGITDQNLVALNEYCPDQVKVIVYTRHDEAATGGDWEWWITDGKESFIGFRVQAKVLRFGDEDFPQLHYRTHGGQDQTQRLIDSCGTYGVPVVPIYCFYLHWIEPYKGMKEFIGRDYSGHRKRDFGCSIMTAYSVLESRSKKKFIELLPKLSPWHHLVGVSSNNSETPDSCQKVSIQDLAVYWRGQLPEDFLKVHYAESLIVNKGSLPRSVQTLIEGDRGATGEQGISYPNSDLVQFAPVEGVAVFSQQ